MKIIETDLNVTTVAELNAGDVFRKLPTQEVFMKLSSSSSIGLICEECDNECEYFLDDYAVNLETGKIESFYLLEKVVKCDATLTVNK